MVVRLFDPARNTLLFTGSGDLGDPVHKPLQSLWHDGLSIRVSLGGVDVYVACVGFGRDGECVVHLGGNVIVRSICG
jgi:hypothetical protein